MATIYRFIVESRTSTPTTTRTSDTLGGDSRALSTSVARRGRHLSGLGSRGGVEHNRKLRAINPLLNRVTHGYWEKGMRVGRAGIGLITTGSMVGLTILVSFMIQTLLKWQNFERQRAEKQNSANFKSMENGFSAIHGEFTTSVNVFNGKKTYNENR